MPTELPGWVQQHADSLFTLELNVKELGSTPPDLKTACELLVKLSEFKTWLSLIQHDMEAITVKLFETEEIFITDDGTTVEKKFDTNRKAWKHKELATVVADRIRSMAIDLDTGEVTLTPDQMVVKLLEFVQPSYWRLRPLNEIGINPDDYCTVGDTKPVISIRKAK